jgi:hypothetical protein
MATDDPVHNGLPFPSEGIPEIPIPVPMVLAFRLLGTVPGPDDIGRALQRPEVQRAMQKGGNDVAAYIARQSLWKSPAAMTEKEKTAIFDKVLAAHTDPLQRHFSERFYSSPRLRALELSLKTLARDIDAAAGGVFTDQGWVYVVGSAVAALGTGAALWRFRSGDAAMKPIVSLAGKQLPVLELGSFELGAQLLKFAPEQHEIKTKLLATYSWQRVQARLSVTGSWSDGSSAKVSGTGQIVVPIGHGVSLTAAGKTGPEAKDNGLALGWTFNNGQIDLSLWATYGSAPSLAPSRPSSPGSPPGAAVLATVSLRF